jgi:hypothetical protein
MALRRDGAHLHHAGLRKKVKIKIVDAIWRHAVGSFSLLGQLWKNMNKMSMPLLGQAMTPKCRTASGIIAIVAEF